MDGNGRWAKQRSLPRIMGHREGAKSVRAITEACAELKVKYLTLYAFSTENWKRPHKEVAFLMNLLSHYLVKEKNTMMKNNIRLLTIGDTSKLPLGVKTELSKTIKLTSKNTGLSLVLALNYGAKDEITKAIKTIAKKCISRKISPSKITEQTIADHLYTKNIPDPDLMIRTSGEMRISNFLVWQLAYAEFYITDILWPDFRKAQLVKAIEEYNNRDRRFGGVRNA